MTFDVLPLRVTRWQMTAIIAAIFVSILRAGYSFWIDRLWDGVFSTTIALAAGFSWWFIRYQAPVTLELDDAELRLSKFSSTATIVPWNGIETIHEGTDSLSIYYRRDAEPLLFTLESSSFRSEDWGAIRSLICSHADCGEQE